MSLRICFVTPFPWPQPHDVNEHVRGVSDALRRRGHAVTVIAPSTRATDLHEGRRALQRRELGELVAIGAAVPTSLTDRIALPVGVRANLAAALAIGRFDVVHGVEPGLPSLSYAALLEAETLTAATFFSPERLTLARKNRRARLLARVDALLATSNAAATAAARRFPGDFTVIAPGVDPDRFAPGVKRKLIVVETGTAQNAIGRAVLRALRSLPVWDLALARTSPLALRPTIPPSVRDRAYVRSVVKPEARRSLLAEAALFVPFPTAASACARRPSPADARSSIRTASSISRSSQPPRSRASQRTTTSAAATVPMRGREPSPPRSTTSPRSSSACTAPLPAAGARRGRPWVATR